MRSQGGLGVLVICGEVLIDLVPASCAGESGFVARGGGSPYNVAVGLGRLGSEVGFLGRVSRDRFGRLLRDRLEANAVDLRYLAEGPEPTTLAVVHLAAGAEPEFGFYDQGTADRLIEVADLPATLPDRVYALHFGSISLVREPGASAFEALLLREHGRRLISLDPNVRPSLIPDRATYLRRLETWVRHADLVKVSAADLRWLYPERRPDDVAREWLDAGPALVVVTHGERGSHGLATSGAAEVPGRPVTVADTVGAGDAFTAGLLAWLDEHDALTREALDALAPAAIGRALDFADSVASLTCTRTGAEPPTRGELPA